MDVFTKISDPDELPHDDCESCSYSDDGQYLTLGASSAPTVLMYQQILGVFTKMPSPGATPAGAIRGIDFGDNDGYIAAATLSSPYVYNYKMESRLPDIDTGDAITPTLAYIKTGL